MNRAPCSTAVEFAALALCLLALLGIVGAGASWGFHVAMQRARVRAGWRDTPAATVEQRAAQHARLSEYRVLDREARIAALPIERAMELVAADFAAARAEESAR